MRKAEFEKQLFIAIEGYFGLGDWKDKSGRDFTWVMDELAMNSTDEQWLIVDETLSMLKDPDYIVSYGPADLPVSENQWESDHE